MYFLGFPKMNLVLTGSTTWKWSTSDPKSNKLHKCWTIRRLQWMSHLSLPKETLLTQGRTSGVFRLPQHDFKYLCIATLGSQSAAICTLKFLQSGRGMPSSLTKSKAKAKTPKKNHQKLENRGHTQCTW